PAQMFASLGRDIAGVLKTRSGWTGLLLCSSPVGTAAAMQLFTSFADRYSASPRLVTLTNGYVSGAIMLAGCFIGGALCDRMDRRRAYLLHGALLALCASTMALAPLRPSTYVTGCLAYLFVSGMCYSSITCFVLDVVGGECASATAVTLYTGASNLA